jgi:hypothetical protein
MTPSFFAFSARNSGPVSGEEENRRADVRGCEVDDIRGFDNSRDRRTGTLLVLSSAVTRPCVDSSREPSNRAPRKPWPRQSQRRRERGSMESPDFDERTCALVVYMHVVV